MGLIKELQEAKEEILLHNALDWKKFKILVAVCCSYVVSQSAYMYMYMYMYICSMWRLLHVAWDKNCCIHWDMNIEV